MTTTKYGLYNTGYGVQGWDALMESNADTLDEVIHTNISITLGETVGQYKAVGIFSGETKFKLALSGGKLQPALGLTLTSGVDTDQINIQRVGKITNAGWSWTIGKPIFLSPSVAGELTQSPSGTTQLMGFADSATSMILSGCYDYASLPTTTSTTSTTSSTTSSTTTTT